nr:hypothetical protein [uncultured Gellertiella sp.]
MKRFCLVLLGIMLVTRPASAEVRSVYTKIDLKTCQQIVGPDGFVYEGSWRCKGLAGHDVLLSADDSREMVAFGKNLDGNCSSHRTFSGFNSAGATVEWRLRDGKPFATILRWTVNPDNDNPDRQVTWLVVSKLENSNSCPMHYVAGSWPKANEQARKVADDRAEGFDCTTGVPGFDSAIGDPGISLQSCTGE